MAAGALPTFPANSFLHVHWAAGSALHVLNAAAPGRVDAVDARWCVRVLHPAGASGA
jgi:hypothetical protein